MEATEQRKVGGVVLPGRMRRPTSGPRGADSVGFRSSRSPWGVDRSSSDLWRASLLVDGKLYELGLFATKEQAAIQHDRAAIHFFGRSASTNNPLSMYKDELVKYDAGGPVCVDLPVQSADNRAASSLQHVKPAGRRVSPNASATVKDEELARQLQMELDGRVPITPARELRSSRERKPPQFFSPQTPKGYSGYHNVEFAADRQQAKGRHEDLNDPGAQPALKEEHGRLKRHRQNANSAANGTGSSDLATASAPDAVAQNRSGPRRDSASNQGSDLDADGQQCDTCSDIRGSSDGGHEDVPSTSNQAAPHEPCKRLPKLPMIKVNNCWYRAKTVRETARRICVQIPGFPNHKSEWLERTDDRVWRGSYKGKDWRYLGNGGWEPKPTKGRKRPAGHSRKRHKVAAESRHTEEPGTDTGCEPQDKNETAEDPRDEMQHSDDDAAQLNDTSHDEHKSPVLSDGDTFEAEWRANMVQAEAHKHEADAEGCVGQEVIGEQNDLPNLCKDNSPGSSAETAEAAGGDASIGPSVASGKKSPNQKSSKMTLDDNKPSSADVGVSETQLQDAGSVVHRLVKAESASVTGDVSLVKSERAEQVEAVDAHISQADAVSKRDVKHATRSDRFRARNRAGTMDSNAVGRKSVVPQDESKSLQQPTVHVSQDRVVTAASSSKSPVRASDAKKESPQLPASKSVHTQHETSEHDEHLDDPMTYASDVNLLGRRKQRVPRRSIDEPQLARADRKQVHQASTVSKQMKRLDCKDLEMSGTPSSMCQTVPHTSSHSGSGRVLESDELDEDSAPVRKKTMPGLNVLSDSNRSRPSAGRPPAAKQPRQRFRFSNQGARRANRLYKHEKSETSAEEDNHQVVRSLKQSRVVAVKPSAPGSSQDEEPPEHLSNAVAVSRGSKRMHMYPGASAPVAKRAAHARSLPAKGINEDLPTDGGENNCPAELLDALYHEKGKRGSLAKGKDILLGQPKRAHRHPKATTASFKPQHSPQQAPLFQSKMNGHQTYAEGNLLKSGRRDLETQTRYSEDSAGQSFGHHSAPRAIWHQSKPKASLPLFV